MKRKEGDKVRFYLGAEIAEGVINEVLNTVYIVFTTRGKYEYVLEEDFL